MTTDPEKLKAVRELLTPKNKHDIRSFLGLCTYYKPFISGFVNLEKQLTKLTEQKPSFKWAQRWKQPSKRPRKPCVLLRFLPTPSQARERFIVDTDASNVGIGGVLSQVQGGQE
jgi:hypothetical protein